MCCCKISNLNFINHAYMVLMGLKRMRFVDQIAIFLFNLLLCNSYLWLYLFFPPGLGYIFVGAYCGKEITRQMPNYFPKKYFFFFQFEDILKFSYGWWQIMKEDDDIINSWNLRKCSATGLDILSTILVMRFSLSWCCLFRYFLCLVVHGTCVVAKCHIMLHCRL